MADEDAAGVFLGPVQTLPGLLSVDGWQFAANASHGSQLCALSFLSDSW